MRKTFSIIINHLVGYINLIQICIQGNNGLPKPDPKIDVIDLIIDFYYCM